MVKSAFRKSMNRFVRWAMKNDEPQDCEMPSPSYGGNSIKSMTVSGIGDRNNGMNFTVFAATGGKVVQFATYDPVRDRHQSSLYVITDREDLGEELGQIITKESLCR